MHVRDRICARDQAVDEVYFPLTCVFSTVAEGAEGQIAEVATIGNEGVAGLTVFLGVDRSATLDTFVHVVGDALAMRARIFAVI